MSRVISQHELGLILQDSIARGIPVLEPTIEERVEYFAPEFLLQIARRREFDVRLSANGSINFSDEVPVWFADALKIYRDELVQLMESEFLGSWQ